MGIPDRTPEKRSGHLHLSVLDDEARKRLSQGGKILLIPSDHKAIEEQSVGGLLLLTTGTMPCSKHFGKRRPRSFAGHPLTDDEKHPLFRQFPTGTIATGNGGASYAMPALYSERYTPRIQAAYPVETMERNHKLGLLFEFAVDNGKVFCMSNLEAIRHTPEEVSCAMPF